MTGMASPAHLTTTNRSRISARVGAVVSVDLFYEREGSRADVPADALAVEMEAAALLAIGAASNVAVACVLAVTDTFAAGGERTRIDEQGLRAAGERLGEVALAALGPMPRAA